jgi:hypothetical protein
LSIARLLLFGYVHCTFTYIVEIDNVGMLGVSGACPVMIDVEVEYAPLPYLLIALT